MWCLCKKYKSFKEYLINYCDSKLKGTLKHLVVILGRETILNVMLFTVFVWLATKVNPKSLGEDEILVGDKKTGSRND